MRVLPRQFTGAVALALVGLSLVVTSEVIALDKVDTTHTGVGAMVYVQSNGVKRNHCSGTLVAPNVFLTAGHCTFYLKPLWDIGFVTDIFVTFDTHITDTSPLVRVVDLITHPEFPGNTDIGVAILDTDVLHLPLTVLPTAGLLDQLHAAPRTPVLSVGFGRDSNDHHGVASPHVILVSTGIRAWGILSYRALNPDYIIVTELANQGSDNTCLGDSGGPNFLMVDGKEQLVAMSVGGSSYACEEIGWLNRLDTSSARDFLGQFVDLP